MTNTTNTPRIGALALKAGRDRYYARPITRIYPDGAVEVRLPGGNSAHYEAGTFTVLAG